MIVTRRTYRKRSLECVLTLEQQQQQQQQPENPGNAVRGDAWISTTKRKQPTQAPPEKPQLASSSDSIMSKISRKRTLVRRRQKASSSSEQQKYSRPVSLLPLPLLHLGNCSAAVGVGGGGLSSSSTQQNCKQYDDRASGLESDYSSDDSSAHSEDYYRQQQLQQLQHQTPPPPPQASSAVAQLIEDKVVRLQAERAKQVKRQRRVQEEREKGEWMNYNLRLSIYLQARRAEKAKQAAEKRAKEANRAADRRADELKQAAEIAAIKAARVDEAAISLPQNRAVLERNLYFAQHVAKRDEIDHGHINIHKNKAALQDQLNFSQRHTLTFKEVEIATRTQTIPKKAKKVAAEEKVEFDKIGKITPSLATMIAQAALELRPIPKEHKKEFKPICNDAAEIGKFMRLKEEVVEAQGTRTGEELEKIFKKETTSTAIKPWTKGMGTVTLPKFDNARSEAFNIVNEAAALGRLVALKPKVTRNYDEELDYLDDEETDNVDILAVDEKGHKDFRMKYLTDIHVRHHRKEKKKDWDITNLDQTIHDDLDKVELPTGALPVYNKGRKQLSRIEIKEGIAQGVAEKLWERQYRLERPEAELRIRPACACKYCKTSNPYQTHAYRKKWLIRQGLWVEPEEEPEPRHAKTRPDPLADLRKRLVVEKKKEEEIRREAERQKWLAESKDLYSKPRLKQLVEKDAPVLDPSAVAVEQRKENLAVAHRRANVIKETTAPVPVVLGESVLARKKKLFSRMSENFKTKTSAATETAWERDHKGRWIARTGGEQSTSVPEWVNKTRLLRHVSVKSKTTASPTASSSASPKGIEDEANLPSDATMPPKDLTIKPDNVYISAKGVVPAQPTNRRMEFLKIHLKPPSLQSPWSPKSSKGSNPPKSPTKHSPRSAKVVKPKKPGVKKSLREQLAEKRKEILKKAPSFPKDVRLKPVAKLPPSLKEVPLQPTEKKAEFRKVHLKSRRSIPVPTMPDLLTASKGAGATTTPARNTLSVEEDFVEEEWSAADEAADAEIYDDDEIIDETIHDEEYDGEHYIERIVEEKEEGDDDDDYTEILDEDDECYTEIVEESENEQVGESSVVDHVNVDAGSEDYDDSKEFNDDDNGDDSSCYHSHGSNMEKDDVSFGKRNQERRDQPSVDPANSFHMTPLLRRQSLQLIKDIREIMEEGYRDEEAKHSSALVNSGMQGSSGVENNGVQSLPILDDFDASGAQGSSEFDESRSLQGQDGNDPVEAHEGNDATKVQEDGTGEDHPVTKDKVEDSPVIEVSLSDDDGYNVEQATADTSNESKAMQHEPSSSIERGRETTPNDRKKGKKGIFKQLGRTFGSMLGR